MQKLRYVCQLFFLILTLLAVFFIGANAEIWCPFGGIEAIYTYWTDGTMPCSLGVSNFYILVAVLLLTLLMRRVFCGYICPIGTISFWLGKLGKYFHLGPAHVPPRLDRILSLLKYPVLAIILWFTYTQGELWFRGIDPCYALISRHGEDITMIAYLVAGMVALGSLLVFLPFCRWLCPLAAVMNPVSRYAPTKIQRNEKVCIQCGKCARCCPMEIPVDQVTSVTHARCMSCLECRDQCPASGALRWSFPRPVLYILLFAIIILSVVAYQIHPLPSFVKEHGTPEATTASISLSIENLTCRGRANLLFYFLTRDDMFQIPGYIRLEAWPGPGQGRAVIHYEIAKTTPSHIQSAITEPYCEGQDFSTMDQSFWRDSPFTIHKQE